ncbi:MAG: PSD1 and planctomycete cytochrome C domain-containing protein, partial [Verrucomicrobium sp.]
MFFCPAQAPRIFACLSASVFTLACAAQGAAPLTFEKDIRPILSNRCFSCHGEEKQKGNLRLDDVSHILSGGDSGAALVAGKPDESLIVQAIRYTKEDFQMPPKEKLPDEEIAKLEKWIKLGAPWPKSKVAVRSTADEFGFTKEDREQWALQPLSKPKVPALAGNTWAKGDIDAFVAAKQGELKLKPAPEATPQELVRRLYFDLHGLPPTPEQTAAFVAKHDEKSYEALVDDLLASPRYGERWAQHWLDLVRYAESDGYNADGYRDAVWPYRDWVIKSLNDDMPYNQFVKLQLAGDEIDSNNPDVMIATSYLRNGIYEWNQRDVKGQWEIIVTDMTDNAGEVFLGLSFGCARCHDHKFDPILQKDYYRLKAFFAPVLWRDDMKLATAEEQVAFKQKQSEWEAATSDVRSRIDGMTQKSVENSMKKAKEKFSDDLQVMINKAPEERETLEHQLACLAQRQVDFERVRYDPMKSIKKPEDKEAYKALIEELKKYDAIKPKPLMDAFVATDAGTKGPPNVLKTRRGEDDIAPGFLTILEPKEPEIKPTATSTGRRLALADWITRPDNQLSTRVIVNRVWQYHFGRGIAGTPSDFGNMGEKPTHPELLDHLARKFVAEGWSLKKLHKEILLSATYRQTALRTPPAEYGQVDPGNKFLWRFPPRRLDAEQARDAMLMASGELDLKMGGPASDSKEPRRSIYTRKKRNSQDELLRSLDAPANFISTSERQSTTTPTQALLMVNGDWILTRARKLAARSNSVEGAWSNALGRAPNPRELKLVDSFLKHSLGGSTAPATAGSTAADSRSDFKVGSPQERLLVKDTAKEGDDFSVEALFTLNSVDAAASVRTIASRWNSGKDTQESFGWSLGITGEKSRFKAGNLVIQLVGEDDNANIAYEVVASDIRIAVGKPYHIVVHVSATEKIVEFAVTDLSQPGSAPQTATVKHRVKRGLGNGVSSLVIGGLNQRAPSHQWDGRLDAVRLVPGELAASAASPNASSWKEGLAIWDANRKPTPQFEWMGADAKTDSDDPFQRALA